MKNVFQKDLKKKLGEIIGLMKQEGSAESLRTVIRYLMEAGDKITREDLNQAVKPLFENKRGELMPTIAETLRQEGMQIGLQRGRQEGTAALTLRLLQKRFGKIDELTQAQISALSFEQLEQLGEALLDFTSVDDLANWLKANAGKMS